MPLISFAILMSGITFVIRTLHVFRDRGLISAGLVTNSGTAIIACMCFSQFFGALMLIPLLALALLAIFWAIEQRRLQRCRERVPIFLDRWILNLRLGTSVRSAREAALQVESEDLQALLRPIFETRGGDRGTHPILTTNIRRELENISLEQHSALPRLENLRQIIRKTADFRRKSGQAVRQTAIQSAFMLILLIAMAMFVIRRYGWMKCADLITGAFFLSIIGVVLMAYISRKRKWNF